MQLTTFYGFKISLGKNTCTKSISEPWEELEFSSKSPTNEQSTDSGGRQKMDTFRMENSYSCTDFLNLLKFQHKWRYIFFRKSVEVCCIIPLILLYRRRKVIVRLEQ